MFYEYMYIGFTVLVDNETISLNTTMIVRA